jgi:hypothetical protein
MGRVERRATPLFSIVIFSSLFQFFLFVCTGVLNAVGTNLKALPLGNAESGGQF